MTILLQPGCIGVPGAWPGTDVLIIFTSGITIPHDNRDRRAQAFTFVYPRQDLRRIRLFSIRRDFTLSGSSAGKLLPKFCFVKHNSGWTTIHNTAEGCAVTFTKGRDSEQCSERIHLAIPERSVS
jgi:hypothetical protein